MYTSTNRITGLSGLDTESMIRKLMDAESIRLTTMQKARQKLVWQQESYRNVSASLKSFQTSMLNLNTSNSLRLASNFKGLVSTVKVGGETSSAISVSASSSAKAGDYKLVVDKIAKADTYTGTEKVGGTIDLKDIDFTKLQAGDSIKISLDGATAKEITFDAADLTSKADFAAALNTKLSVFGTDSGVNKVNASYDVANDKVVIGTTPGHKITLTDGAREGTKFTGTAIDYSQFGDTVSGNFKVTTGGVDTDVTFSFDATAFKNEDGTYDTVKLNAFMQTAMNAAIKSAGIDSKISASVSSDGKITFNNLQKNEDVKISQGTDNSFSKLGFSSDVNLRSTSSAAAMGIASGKTNQLDLNSPITSVFGEDIFDGQPNASIKINNVDIMIEKTDSISAVMRKINESGAGVKVEFDASSSLFSLSNKATGANNVLTFSDTSGTFLKDVMKLDMSDTSTRSAGQDAVFMLNGETTTRESNNFTINGLNINLNTDAENKTFDIKLSSNSEGALNLVKNFVKEYNSMIDAMNAEYRTQRPKSDKYSYYEPLSDAEKEAMKEGQIEDWEKKAKTGLNYNDRLIGGIATQLRSMIYTPVKLEDGTTISLHEIGITTSSDLGESGKLVLDEDKFNAAFTEREEDIAALFTKSSTYSAGDKPNRNNRLNDEGIGERFNDIINWAITAGGSLYEKAGIVNTASSIDNDMYKIIKDQEDRITNMRISLAKKENYYYQMFSRLEAAMMQSESQMASLQDLLGL